MAADPKKVTELAGSMIAMGYELGMSAAGIRLLFDPDGPRPESSNMVMDLQLNSCGFDVTAQELRVEVTRLLDLMTVASPKVYDQVATAAKEMIDVGRRVGLDDAAILAALGPDAVDKGDTHDQGLDSWLKRTKRPYTTADLRNEIGRMLRQ